MFLSLLMFIRSQKYEFKIQLQDIEIKKATLYQATFYDMIDY